MEYPKLGNKSAAAVLDRLQTVFGVKNDNQLGEKLDVNRSTLGNWRSRDSVPYTYCVDIAASRGISLDWLLTGEGEMLRRNAAGQGPQEERGEYAMPSAERALLAAYRALDEEDQQAVESVAREKKRLRDIEMQLKELVAAVAALNRSP
ncbi:helix-turn-helix transcriptional regulator [Stutzerimonas xanthomarina]|uniref:helix-turn-helix transcriptional regulator n=1 Tax=Stutzerimonas xanthomarina TaxID=271420 RepID=UPI003AA81543